MKKQLPLIFVFFFGCGASTDADPELENKVKIELSSLVSAEVYSMRQDYHHITDCLTATWGLAITPDLVFISAHVGNVCPYPISFFSRSGGGGAAVNLGFSSSTGVINWCPHEWEWDGKWMVVELPPGKVQAAIGGMVLPDSLEAPRRPYDTVTIAWPRPSGAEPKFSCGFNESSHIFKTYPLQLTEEEVEILTKELK